MQTALQHPVGYVLNGTPAGKPTHLETWRPHGLKPCSAKDAPRADLCRNSGCLLRGQPIRFAFDSPSGVPQLQADLCTFGYPCCWPMFRRRFPFCWHCLFVLTALALISICRNGQLVFISNCLVQGSTLRYLGPGSFTCFSCPLARAFEAAEATPTRCPVAT